MASACGSSSHATVDAMADVTIPAGNFSCVGQPRQMTAPPTITIAGKLTDSAGVGIGGAAVEIHSLIDGSLLGQGTSVSTQTTYLGGYGVSINTGGSAPSINTTGVSGAIVTVAGAEKLVYVDEQGNLAPALTATTAAGAVVPFNVPAGAVDWTITAGPYTYRAWPFNAQANAQTFALLAP